MPDMDKISRGEAIALIKALGGGGGTGDITDVQINGTSIVSGGVANVPVASSSAFGAVKVADDSTTNRGIYISSGQLMVAMASSARVKAGAVVNNPIVPYCQHESAFYGLAKAAGADMKDIASTTVGIYPAAQKSAISTMLHAPETVTGTTPAITALPGVRYICGECATLDITTPASGIVDIVFESGSTPTVLTVTPPTGVTVSWANGFDPTSLAANTTYELSLETVGTKCLAVAGEW